MIALGPYVFIPHNGFAKLCGRSTVSRIQDVVAQYYNISPIHMTSEDRRHAVSHPRQVAMFLTREITQKSLTNIAQRFGGKDHTTVIHAIRAVEKRRRAKDSVWKDIETLRERLVG